MSAHERPDITSAEFQLYRTETIKGEISWYYIPKGNVVGRPLLETYLGVIFDKVVDVREAGRALWAEEDERAARSFMHDEISPEAKSVVETMAEDYGSKGREALGAMPFSFSIAGWNLFDTLLVHAQLDPLEGEL